MARADCHLSARTSRLVVHTWAANNAIKTGRGADPRALDPIAALLSEVWHYLLLHSCQFCQCEYDRSVPSLANWNDWWEVILLFFFYERASFFFFFSKRIRVHAALAYKRTISLRLRFVADRLIRLFISCRRLLFFLYLFSTLVNESEIARIINDLLTDSEWVFFKRSSTSPSYVDSIIHIHSDCDTRMTYHLDNILYNVKQFKFTIQIPHKHKIHSWNLPFKRRSVVFIVLLVNVHTASFRDEVI